MKIGTKIKKLREQQNVTQEKLAKYLGISYQAVSKWENDTALPDITLVVPLANFFGVSADELFSINTVDDDTKISEYMERRCKLEANGDYKTSIDLLREALKEYPRSYITMVFLAEAIFHNAKQTETQYENEVIQLCERIREDCTDDHIRYRAALLLCHAYPKIGQKDKALELARMIPSVLSNFGTYISDILEDEKKIVVAQQNFRAALHILFSQILGPIKHGDEVKNILLYETGIKMHEAIFYDDNMLWHNCQVAGLYERLVIAHLLEGNLQEAVDRKIRLLQHKLL